MKNLGFIHGIIVRKMEKVGNMLMKELLNFLINCLMEIF